MRKLRRQRKLYYVETGMGCCLVEGLSEQEVEKEKLKEVGTWHGVQEVREATKQDVHHISSMGGYVPESYRYMAR